MEQVDNDKLGGALSKQATKQTRNTFYLDSYANSRHRTNAKRDTLK